MTERLLSQDRQVETLNQGIVQAGCVYKKGNVLIPSKTGDFIYEMNTEEEMLRKEQARMMGRFFAEGAMKLANDPNIREWLGVEESTLKLIHDTNPNNLPWTIYFGLDLCGDPMVINDLNPDRSVIVGYQPEIIEVFSKVHPQFEGHSRSFYDGLLKTVHEISGNKPKVFVLTEEEDPHEVAYQKFANRFGFTIGSIQNFDPTSVDLVIRAMKTVDILEDPEKYSKLIESLKGGLPIINPLGSYIGGNKGWLTILRASGAIEEGWFPPSWIVKNSKVMDHKGEVGEIRGNISFFKENRKQFVLKEAFSAGGWKVHIGAELKKWQWDELWDQVLASKNAWVVEGLQPKNEKQVLAGEYDQRDGGFKISMERLNIIQRIYAISSNGNFDQIYAEVFGKRGLKVNASGYSFPVAFGR